MPSQMAAIVFFGVLGLLILIIVPKLQIRKIRSNQEPKGPLELENDYRQTIVQILGGILVIGTAASAIQSVTLAQRSLDLTRQGQIADRAFKAFEMLSKDSMDGKMAATYTLLQVANDDENSEWPITETLYNYLQNHYAWSPKKIVDRPYPPRDVTAISDYLRKRPYMSRDNKCLEEQQCWDYEQRNRPSEADIPDYYNKIINIPNLDLRMIFLERAMLKTANINMSHMEKAWLRHAHFENAYGFETHLDNADLSDSSWQFANLQNANLSSAQLCRGHFEHVYAEGANLANSDLHDSHWEDSQQYRVTNLKDADLTCTQWGGANVDGLYLEGAKLYGADLRGATHLTKEQLAKAHGDGSTLLSDENLRPPNWSNGQTMCQKVPKRPYCPLPN
jgi:uncharacterized protein YjbI with pentapeptide repeats